MKKNNKEEKMKNEMMNDNIIDPEYNDGIAKNELDVFFVIDNSGSMAGEKINAVNNAIRDVMSIMPDIQDETSNVTIKINSLVFNNYANWTYNEPQEVENFKWNDIPAIGGTDYSAVCDALTMTLSKRKNGGIMPDFGGVAPIIIFMSDGEPNTDWASSLWELNKRGWFKVALKYAIAIQVHSSQAKNELAKFTGSDERVIQVSTAEALRKLIKAIAVTSSQVKSQSSTTNSNFGTSINTQVDQEIKNNLQDVNGITW